MFITYFQSRVFFIYSQAEKNHVEKTVKKVERMAKSTA
jgi:hypothetical protein